MSGSFFCVGLAGSRYPVTGPSFCRLRALAYHAAGSRRARFEAERLMAALRLTHYVDVLSSWSFVAERALAALRERHGDRLDYEWRIAFLFNGGPMGYSPQLAAWQYRRNEAVTGVKLNPAWRES